MNRDEIIKKKAEKAFDGKGIKRVGLAIDSYKRRKFVRKLNSEKFDVGEIKPFSLGVLVIFIDVTVIS